MYDISSSDILCPLSYTCDEELKTCVNVLASRTSKCTSNCIRRICTPNCRPWDTCGEDGCGGYCGKQACSAGLQCINGLCQPGSEGTCGHPFNLAQLTKSEYINRDSYQLSPTVVSSVIYGELKGHIDEKSGYTSMCTKTPTDNIVYGFELIQLTGLHLRVEGLGTKGHELDTVVDLRRLDRVCSNMENVNWISDNEKPCNDDDDGINTNGLGSRLSAFLSPGKYSIVVSGYNSNQRGPFALHLDFTPDCMSSCMGKMCGVDECGVTCGSCDSNLNQTCDELNSLCQLPDCIHTCRENSCGDDGCGNKCAICKDGLVCDEESKTCVTSASTPCDGKHHTCDEDSKPASGSHFCGEDCKWHDINENLPDLTLPSESDFKENILFTWQNFDNDWEVCMGGAEGCILNTGERFLMKFDTLINNVGSGDFSLGFENHPMSYSKCTKEWYYDIGLYTVRLYKKGDSASPLVVKKLNRCLKDSGTFGENYKESDGICQYGKSCKNQGISSMAYHVNIGDEICQWMDITELTQGCWYDVEVTINEEKLIMEKYFKNNLLKFPIYIPMLGVGSKTLNYKEAMLTYNENETKLKCKI